MDNQSDFFISTFPLRLINSHLLLPKLRALVEMDQAERRGDISFFYRVLCREKASGAAKHAGGSISGAHTSSPLLPFANSLPFVDSSLTDFELSLHISPLRTAHISFPLRISSPLCWKELDSFVAHFLSFPV